MLGIDAFQPTCLIADLFGDAHDSSKNGIAKGRLSVQGGGRLERVAGQGQQRYESLCVQRMKQDADTDEQHSPTEYVDDYEEPLTECSSEVAQEELGDEPRSIILSMLAQVTKGMDLHRIAFPTFVLEPRSMLERITDFMSHPQLILQ